MAENHAPLEGASEGMNGRLRVNFVGEYKIVVKNVNISGRLVSTPGISVLMSSIKVSGGFLPQYAPLVVVDSVDIPAEGFNAENAKTAPVKVLDGAVRTMACMKLYGGDFAMPCRVYRSFEPTEHEIIARFCNNAAKAVVPRGVADNIFFFNKLLDGFRLHGKPFPGAKAIAEAYTKAGVTPPSQSVILRRKKVDIGMSTAAFRALCSLQEEASRNTDIDMESFTWTLLATPLFLSAKETPSQQALLMEHMARFKSRNDKALGQDDLPHLNDLARDSLELRARVVTAFGDKANWSKELESLVDRYSHKQTDALESIVRPWLKEVNTVAAAMNEKLPAGQTMSAYQRRTIVARPMPRVLKVAMKDDDMKARYEEYQAELQQVTLALNLQELVPAVACSTGGEGGDPEAGGNMDVGYNADMSDTFSGAPDLDDISDEGEDERTESRSSKGSQGKGKSKAKSKKAKEKKKKQKKAGGSVEPVAREASAGSRKSRNRGSTPSPEVLTSQPTTIAMEERIVGCMTQNFVVHQDFDLDAKSRAELADLDLRKEAKLVVLNIAAFPDLLKTDKASEQSLVDLLYSVRHSMVHVKGTIALLIPPPWHLHSGRLYSALTTKRMAVFIEDHMLTLQYNGSGGGRPASATHGHLKFSQDGVMLVHMTQGSTKYKADGFTVNTSVTTDDLFGNRTVTGPATSASILTDVAYEGAHVDWPRKALLFLINRYTNQGDTVLVFGADNNAGVETALSRGRLVEAFVSSPSKVEAVEKAGGTAFRAAFAKGIFQIGKNCITCVQSDPTIKEGDVLLSGPNIESILHYTCARSKRKDFLRVVFAAQDKRAADYHAKESGNTAEKKAKLEAEEAAVDYSVLAPDSDDEL